MRFVFTQSLGGSIGDRSSVVDAREPLAKAKIDIAIKIFHIPIRRKVNRDVGMKLLFS